jgi:uncharacterized membrane protein YdbT with pleckstrin-like domain
MDDNQISPETSAKLSNVGRKYFKFIEFDGDEQLIREIRKHPIGLFFIYLTGAFVAIVMATVFSLLIFSNSSDSVLEGTGLNVSSVTGIVSFVGLLFTVFVVVIMVIQAILYINNVIFVTNEKIAQVLYINIFNRKISQLSLGDIQDVTVTQKGILSHIFNYGTLVIETAGEQQNYTFTYIPDPYIASKSIVGAHERNLAQYGN